MSKRKLQCVLVDLSGTVHVEDQEIPDSIKALHRLRRSRLKIKFVTNTTKESKRILFERLKKIGFEISQDEIFTSLSAAVSLVRERQLRPMLLLDSLAMEDFNDIEQDNPNAVIVGLAPEKFVYDTLNDAFRLLLEDCPLVAIHKGRYYRTKAGLSLGPGPFVSALEYATGATSEVVGKPEQEFFLSAIRDLDVEATECVMIGDDVRDDIGGAMTAGMTGILVRTGKYMKGDEGKISPGPDHVVSCFSEAVDLILGWTGADTSS